jgi:hypothetical protein
MYERREMVEPTFELSKTLHLFPKRECARIDKEDPRRVESKIDSTLPTRTHARTDRVDPRLAQSNTERFPDKRVNAPQIDNELPRRDALRKESEDPICR